MAPASSEQRGAAPPTQPPTAAPSAPPPPPFHPFANDSHTAAREEDDHPLIAFRRFADAQFAALLHGFIGLPSSAVEDKPSGWERLVEDQSGEVATEEAEQQRPRRNRWRSHDREDRCMRHHHRHHRRHAQSDDADPSDPLRSAHAAMLTHYLLHDAYSPLALENDPVLGRINWRAAFTELVADGPAEGKSAPSDQPPRDWAVTTAQRWARCRPAANGPAQTGFVIGFPSLHALHAPWDRGLADTMHGLDHGPSLRDAIDEKKREHAQTANTELEMYERFLEGVRPTDSKSPRRQREAATQTEPDKGALVLRAENPKTEKPSQANPQPQPEPLQREPGLIATLTTTEQVVLPDGTTHTKVALKKRFSDGREERKETVHTSHSEKERDWAHLEPTPPKMLQDATPKPKVSVMEEVAKEKKRSRGWFWS